MTQYKYFDQEGNRYSLKSNSTIAWARTVILLLAALYMFFGVSDRGPGVLFFGYFLIFLAAASFLKTTKKLTIDTTARTVTDKHNAFFKERTYRFEDFERFHVYTQYINLIKANSFASIVFDENGKEKSVTLLITLFVTKPAQTAINEASEIMGVEVGM